MIGFRHCMCGRAHRRLAAGPGVEGRVVFRSDDNGTVQGLVGAGMAAALVPLLAADESDEAGGAARRGGGLPERRIALAWHRDRALSSSARAFLESTQRVCDGIQVTVPA